MSPHFLIVQSAITLKMCNSLTCTVIHGVPLGHPFYPSLTLNPSCGYVDHFSAAIHPWSRVWCWYCRCWCWSTSSLVIHCSSCYPICQVGVFGAHVLAPRNDLWCTRPNPCTTEDLLSLSSLLVPSCCCVKLIFVASICRIPISSSCVIKSFLSRASGAT